LALVAVVVSLLDDAQEALAFFIVAAVATALQMWAARGPFVGLRVGSASAPQSCG
jgi:hypothetical protein